jgi:hypothetical protein
MLHAAVTLLALALLFALTALALSAAGMLGRPYRVAAVLAATLAIALVLLLD